MPVAASCGQQRGVSYRARNVRHLGKVRPELRIAARTRSLASFTAVSGSPTMVKAGSPYVEYYPVDVSSHVVLSAVVAAIQALQ
jgi:hypothetical protein